ncbi:nucleoside hydrolase [Pararhodobacter oceanensis]|uniref:nucleoside hydrolase n=1 Tax=Pararhodobacter oceanensis TaxID=2172121 RepID=UPI003A8D86BF
MTATTPMRVIIDTDPGLDDAVGILYALAEPRFAVEGVTAVAGNIGITTTTRNAGSLLAAMGRADVGYAAGAAGPLAGAAINEEAIHGADGMGGVTLPAPLRAPEAMDATAFLAARLMEAPTGALTLLALGPLTNLALLARQAPEAYARISRIIAMGGTIHERGNMGPYAEFNMAADPLAAQEVFVGPVPITLIPLDVTRRLRATPDDLDRLAASSTTAATLSADLIRAYFTGNTERSSRPLHDPCVMLMALEPALFGTDQMRLRVDCETHPGRLIPTEDGARIEVAMRIDAPKALDALWAGLSLKG